MDTRSLKVKKFEIRRYTQLLKMTTPNWIVTGLELHTGADDQIFWYEVRLSRQRLDGVTPFRYETERFVREALAWSALEARVREFMAKP